MQKRKRKNCTVMASKEYRRERERERRERECVCAHSHIIFLLYKANISPPCLLSSLLTVAVHGDCYLLSRHSRLSYSPINEDLDFTIQTSLPITQFHNFNGFSDLGLCRFSSSSIMFSGILCFCQENLHSSNEISTEASFLCYSP